MVGVFRAGQAGGVAEDAGNLGSKDLVGGPEEESGVDPARVGDQGGWPGADEILQLLVFGFEMRAHGSDKD